MDRDHRIASKRINELDFLKFVFITLMIAFHLVYIGDTYPYAKKIVYTFHMPAFILISGYLVNLSKSPKAFIKSMLWIFIPYAIMECGYTVMASILPIREHIDHLTVLLLLEKIFIHPLGPYWYLHTLVLCSVTYYIIFHVMRFGGNMARIIILGLVFYSFSSYCHVLSFSIACYFLAGAVIRQSGMKFLGIFQASFFSVLLLIPLAMVPSNLDKATVGGIVFVYNVIAFLLACYQHMPNKYMRLPLFIGRNTLILLLFSPVFTVLAKLYQPYLLRMEPSGMLFLAVSLVFALAGCFAIAYIMDKLRLSQFFFGKKTVIQ